LPTIFEGVPDDDELAVEENFGPVITI